MSDFQRICDDNFNHSRFRQPPSLGSSVLIRICRAIPSPMRAITPHAPPKSAGVETERGCGRRAAGTLGDFGRAGAGSNSPCLSQRTLTPLVFASSFPYSLMRWRFVDLTEHSMSLRRLARTSEIHCTFRWARAGRSGLLVKSRAGQEAHLCRATGSAKIHQW